MIIIDEKLKEREQAGNPIQVGLVGAGFAARGLAVQLARPVPGMRLFGVANRTLANAEQLVADFNIENAVVTDDFKVLCEDPDIDVIVEATGEVEFGAQVAEEAINNKKHVVLINAELDGTLGPILKQKADRAGVVYTQADGDQPAAIMNLIREVELLGLTPVLGGNIKSLLDHYRTPKTQAKWAAEHFQRPKHVTSFADGTKIAFEMTTVANATGFGVAKRGMLALPAKRVEEAADLFAKHLPKEGGLVDYIMGAEPSFGVFVLAKTDDSELARYLKVYKMGDGPFYTFYRPHHLAPLEAPQSIARAVLFGDAALAPAGGLVTEVCAVAKKDMKAGESLDGIGGFTVYGVLENYEAARQEDLLPMGLTDGCVLQRDVKQDEFLTYADVKLPRGRLCDQLRKEQEKSFS